MPSMENFDGNYDKLNKKSNWGCRGVTPGKPKPKQQTLDEIIAEGDSLLKKEEEEKNKPKSPTNQPASSKTYSNPLEQVRGEVLNNLPRWKAKAIIEMENACGDKTNRHTIKDRLYIEFIEEVSNKFDIVYDAMSNVKPQPCSTTK